MEYDSSSRESSSSSDIEENNFELIDAAVEEIELSHQQSDSNEEIELNHQQSDRNEEIEKTLQLLEAGEHKIKLCESKESILILGNTGAGKSTLTGWLLKDGSQLVSKEIMEDSDEYIIIDDDEKIGRSTVISKTIYPDLFIDSETEETYYDCPGFSDTRSTSHDISITYFNYFNKKLADYAEKVKLVLVVSYPSLRKGVDRADFMKLMKHCTELIKNVNKFKDSICIVVTKVDNMFKKHGHEYRLISDHIIKKAIVDFLQEVKQVIHDQQIADLIDILCIRNEENQYSRIALFRRPNDSGPLSDIELLQQSKIIVQDMIQNNIRFVAKEDEDFGYTISEKSKNDINDLVEKIDEKISDFVKDVANEIRQIYERKTQDMVPILNDREVILDENHLQSIRNLVNGLDKIDEKLRKFVQEMRNFKNPKQLTEKIKILTEFDFKISDHLLTNIDNQGNYLEFLQAVSDKKLGINESNWIVHFQSLTTHVLEFNDKMKIKIVELEKKKAIKRAEQEERRHREEIKRANEEISYSRQQARRQQEEYEKYRRDQAEAMKFVQEQLKIDKENAVKRAQEQERINKMNANRAREVALRREEENRRRVEQQTKALNLAREEARMAREEANRAYNAAVRDDGCTLL